MTTEIQAKTVLVTLFNNAQVPETLKTTLIDEFIANTDMTNMSFQMSFNNLKQALQDNDANNSQLANIIMHANGRGWHTAEALPEMIQYLREQGYTLVTVSQLLGLEPIP